MLADRKIVKVINRNINILIPDYITTEKVEIIIIPYEEPEIKKDVVDYSKYFGISNIGTNKIDNYLNNIRDEWGREFSF